MRSLEGPESCKEQENRIVRLLGLTVALVSCSAKALSCYEELFDEIIRQETGKLEGATGEARLKLIEWELPGLLDAIDSTKV